MSYGMVPNIATMPNMNMGISGMAGGIPGGMGGIGIPAGLSLPGGMPNAMQYPPNYPQQQYQKKN